MTNPGLAGSSGVFKPVEMIDAHGEGDDVRVAIFVEVDGEHLIAAFQVCGEGGGLKVLGEKEQE